MNSQRRLKVLVGAYACNPTMGSEFGVGWGWVAAIARYHDLWVITGAQNRNDIESELARDPELAAHLRFEYVERKRNLRLEKLGKPFYLHTYKHQWLRDAYTCARQMQAEIGFDLVHQLTYIGFRFPGRLWKLNVPFVWGPIGGLQQTTWRLLPALGAKGAAYYTARNLLNDFDRRCRPAPTLAFKRAGVVIAATTGIAEEIRRFYGVDSVVIPEVGLPPGALQSPLRRAEKAPIELLWSGNHLPGKALPLLLRALAVIGESCDWRLSVLGSGPCTSGWKRLCEKLQLNARVRWVGQVPREEALRITQRSHVLAISSVYDLTSTVLVEALSNGIPVICPDHCGFRDAIDATCGIKVPAQSPSQMIQGLSAAVLRIADEDLRYALAQGAIRRSNHYAWERKAGAVDDLYRTLVGGGWADRDELAGQLEPTVSAFSESMSVPR